MAEKRSSLRESVENNLAIWMLGLLVAGFGAGMGASKAIRDISGVICLTPAEELQRMQETVMSTDEKEEKDFVITYLRYEISQDKLHALFNDSNNEEAEASNKNLVDMLSQWWAAKRLVDMRINVTAPAMDKLNDSLDSIVTFKNGHTYSIPRHIKAQVLKIASSPAPAAAQPTSTN